MDIQSKIHVSNIDSAATRDLVHDLFLPFGLILDMSLHAHRGYADIQFEDVDDAQAAIDNMDGAEFQNKILRVRAAKRDEGPAGSKRVVVDNRKALWEQEQFLEQEQQADDGHLSAGTEDTQ